MNILITGGTGYLGLYLTEHLSIHHNVTTFSTSKSSLITVPQIIGDVQDKQLLEKSMENQEVVIHLAGLPYQICDNHPENAHAINVEGTRNVITAAINKGVRHFIYMSTFHIYGKTPGTITEQTQPSPQTIYAKTKFEAEQVCRSFGDKIPVSICRLSNTYGPPKGDKGWDLVVQELCKQAKENNKIVLHTAGKQKRDFVGIPDVLSAIDILLNASSTNATYNVGGDCLLSIYELAECVAKAYKELFNSTLNIEINTDNNPKPYDFVFDSSKIKSLGYQPKTILIEEIKKTLSL